MTEPLPTDPAPKDSSPSRLRSTALACFATVAIAAAGYAIWQQRAVIVEQIAPLVQAAPEPLAASGASSDGIPDPRSGGRSLLWVKAGGGSPGQSGQTTLALGKIVSPELDGASSSFFDLMAHELVRQAVLTAARNELGAMTQDGSLGDLPPAGATNETVEVRSSIRSGMPSQVLLVQQSAAGAKLVWSGPIPGPFTQDKELDVTAFVEQIEPLTRGDLVNALTTLGVKGSRPALAQDGPLDRDVEARLGRMTFTEQFAAIRATHSAIREKGISPQRQGGLIRGYAHLGVLTEFHWNASHKAFKARALLEAQRWVARAPESVDALYHRAYARALVGLHKAALDDLAEAKKRSKDNGPRPEWAALIEAYCLFDTKWLQAVKGGTQGQLAMLLAFLTVENSWSATRAIDVAHELLKDNPECYRVHDATGNLGGVINHHTATLTGMTLFGNQVAARLEKLPGVPRAAGTWNGRAKSEPAIVASLIEAGNVADGSELSWSVLGRMMREIRFAQVWRRSYFLKNSLGTSNIAFLDETRPWVAEHPYFPLLECQRLSYERDRAQCKQLLESIKTSDFEITESSLIFAWAVVDQPRTNRFHTIAIAHCDSIARDVAKRANFLPDNLKGPVLKLQLAISPHDPAVRAWIILNDWKFAEPNVRKWEAESGDRYEVTYALGRHYYEAKDWNEAKAKFLRCLPYSRDKDTYNWLAWCYRQQGDMELWKTTLDKYLAEGSDPSLDFSMTQVDIADYLMDLGKWEEARPYAESAATSYSSKGLMVMARLCLGTKEWAEAEQWARRCSERYPESQWAEWFFICNETGESNLRAARRFAAAHIDPLEARAMGEEKLAFGFFRMINGQPKQALAHFQSVTEPDLLSSGQLTTALFADELGDRALSERAWDQFLNNPKSQSLKSTPLFRMLREGLPGSKAKKLDMAAVDAILQTISEEGRGNATFYLSWFLRNRGDNEQAKRYLKLSAASPYTYIWSKAVAFDALRRLGVPNHE